LDVKNIFAASHTEHHWRSLMYRIEFARNVIFAGVVFSIGVQKVLDIGPFGFLAPPLGLPQIQPQDATRFRRPCIQNLHLQIKYGRFF
jgi:hypothetical protein